LRHAFVAVNTIKDLEEKIGRLSLPSKMPCFGYSTPAKKCITGGKLVAVKGSICFICYATKGRYVFPNVQTALNKRFKSLKRKDWVETMVEMISRREKSGFFRWHDSGDVQGVWHMEKIAEVARRLPDIKFWLPTREYSFVSQWLEKFEKPKNLIIRLSAFMIDGAPPVSVAKRLGVLTSGVSSGGFNCPAPKQDNKCMDCRACWNSQKNINYKKH
jgi:hypothetical protein